MEGADWLNLKLRLRSCGLGRLGSLGSMVLDLLIAMPRGYPNMRHAIDRSKAPADLTRLNSAADLIKADRRILASRTTEIVSEGRQASCNLPWLLQLVESQG